MYAARRHQEAASQFTQFARQTIRDLERAIDAVAAGERIDVIHSRANVDIASAVYEQTAQQLEIAALVVRGPAGYEPATVVQTDGCPTVIVRADES